LIKEHLDKIYPHEDDIPAYASMNQMPTDKYGNKIYHTSAQDFEEHETCTPDMLLIKKDIVKLFHDLDKLLPYNAEQSVLAWLYKKPSYSFYALKRMKW
jgi:hypothetical protein